MEPTIKIILMLFNRTVKIQGCLGATIGFLYLLLNIIIIVILRKPANNHQIIVTFMRSSIVLGIILISVLATDIILTAMWKWDDITRTYIKDAGILGYGAITHPIISGFNTLFVAI